MATKVCKECGEEKGVDQYSPSSHQNGKTYLMSYCKPCAAKRNHMYRDARRTKPKRISPIPRLDTESGIEVKLCTTCRKEKPLAAFSWEKKPRGKEGYRANCRECRKIQTRTRYWSDPEKHRQAARDAVARDPERTKEIQRNYYLRHPDRMKARRIAGKLRNPDYSREYYLRNKDRAAMVGAAWRNRVKSDPARLAAHRSQSHDYYTKNKDRLRGIRREWARNNPDYIWRKCAERRARKKQTAGIEKIDRNAIIQRDRATCYLCGDILDTATTFPHVKYITLDHVIPLARGGTHTTDNLHVACHSCNSRKGDNLLSELTWYRGDELPRASLEFSEE